MSGFDSESDEDLKKAIALSLQQPSAESNKAEIIDLVSSEEEDDDLGAPIVTKRVTSSASPRHRADLNMDIVSTGSTEYDDQYKAARSRPPAAISRAAETMPSHQDSVGINGILGSLNRKQMEEERRARLEQKKNIERNESSEGHESKKRKASNPLLSPHDRGGRQVIPKLSEEPSLEASKSTGATLSPKLGIPRASATQRKQINADVQSYREQQRAWAPGIQYPEGVVKKTWVQGCPRQGDDIKIEEVFQKADLDLAVLSAFQVNPDWVERKLNEKTKIVWVLQSKDEAEKKAICSVARKNQRFCFPRMDGNINCMHSKLQLLAHPSHLRIVIPSANLEPYDWGETGEMENVCFLIDLPRHPAEKLTDASELTPFAEELIHFLTAMGLDQGITESLRKFDFSRTARLGFVHSIGGSHIGLDLKRTGYCGLGTAIQKLGLHSEEALSVDLVAASIGSLTIDFIKCLFLALQGDDGMTEYGMRTNRPSKGKKAIGSVAEGRLSADLARLFRIYFPTWDTVAKSKGGIGAGGTICLQSKWYNRDSFPQSLMRTCESHRKGVLMHNKMIFVRPQKPVQGNAAYAYVGSANLSESAWGRLVKDRTSNQPKLNCRNWECGVIIPVPAGDGILGSNDKDQDPPGMDIFKGTVPVPMIVPGEEYGGRKPWFYSEQQ